MSQVGHVCLKHDVSLLRWGSHQSRQGKWGLIKTCRPISMIHLFLLGPTKAS